VSKAAQVMREMQSALRERLGAQSLKEFIAPKK
jgi:hypothetical protein